MQTRIDANKNTVTLIGKKAAHRINTGKRDMTHLKWKTLKTNLGYEKSIEKCHWKETISITNRNNGQNVFQNWNMQR